MLVLWRRLHVQKLGSFHPHRMLESRDIFRTDQIDASKGHTKIGSTQQNVYTKCIPAVGFNKKLQPPR